MDTTYTINNDYDNAINYEWKINNTIPDDYPRWGTFEELHENTLLNLKNICESFSNDNMVGHFYNICINNNFNLIENKQILSLLNDINNINSITELLQIAGELFTNYGISIFFHICKSTDSKNPNKYIPHISQCGITLSDRDYYFTNPDIIDNYHNFIKEITEQFKFTINTNDIIDLETQFAQFHYTKTEKRDPLKTYNKLEWNNFISILGNNWDLYFNRLNLPDMNDIILDCPNFYNEINKIILNTDIHILKDWFKFKVINHFAKFDSGIIRNIHFDFWDKKLNGIEKEKPLWKKIIGWINHYIGEELGKEYVKIYFPSENKDSCIEMINLIKNQLDIKLTNNKWMSESTKEKAILKLNNIKYKIGYPDKWSINYDNFVWNNTKNIIELLEAWYKWDWTYQECMKLYDDVNLDEWHMNPQTINAYFHPILNEIVFPAAILQKPFYSPNNDISSNLGGIGAVIAHEITHAFDDQGRKYNYNGKLENWWSNDDEVRFNKLALPIEEQFNNLSYFNENINGSLTLGECIADIGGLKIASNTLTQICNDNGYNEYERQIRFKKLFEQWATIWRCNIREEYAKKLLMIDPHPPAKFRINAVLGHIDQFYETYDINKKDNMYIEIDKRMSIW